VRTGYQSGRSSTPHDQHLLLDGIAWRGFATFSQRIQRFLHKNRSWETRGALTLNSLSKTSHRDVFRRSVARVGFFCSMGIWCTISGCLLWRLGQTPTTLRHRSMLHSKITRATTPGSHSRVTTAKHGTRPSHAHTTPK
jgi:hypothetical protein